MSRAILSSEFSSRSSTPSHPPDSLIPYDSPLVIRTDFAHTESSLLHRQSRELSDLSVNLRSQSDAHFHTRTLSTDRHPHVWEVDTLYSVDSYTRSSDLTLDASNGEPRPSRMDEDEDQVHEDEDSCHSIPLVLDLNNATGRCDCTDCMSPFLLEDITPEEYLGNDKVADLLSNVSELLSHLAYHRSSHEADSSSMISRRNRCPTRGRPLPPIPVPAPIAIPDHIPDHVTAEVLYCPPPLAPLQLDRDGTENDDRLHRPRRRPAGPRDARVPSLTYLRSEQEHQARETQTSSGRRRAAFYISESPGRAYEHSEDEADGDRTHDSATGVFPPSPTVDIHPRHPFNGYGGYMPRAASPPDTDLGEGSARRTFRVVNTSPFSSGSDADSLTPPGSDPNSASASRSNSDSSLAYGSRHDDDGERSNEDAIFLGSDNDLNDQDQHHEESSPLHYDRRREIRNRSVTVQPPTHGMALAYVDANVNVVGADHHENESGAKGDKPKRSFFRRSKLSPQQQQQPSFQSPGPQSPAGPVGTSMDGWAHYHVLDGGQAARRRAGSEDWTHRRARDGRPNSSLSPSAESADKPRRNRFVSMSLDLGHAFLLSPKSKAAERGKPQRHSSTEDWDAGLPPHRGRADRFRHDNYNRNHDHAGKDGRRWMSRIGLGSKH
ncbi:hypothetical protein IAU59_000474 [Kwoniella sp. CBS 9459]